MLAACHSCLTVQVADLRECLQEKTQAEQQTHSHLTEITNQWQVCSDMYMYITCLSVTSLFLLSLPLLPPSLPLSPSLSLPLSPSLSLLPTSLQSALAAKDSELSDYRDKLDTTQSQLTEAGKDCSRAAIIRMKKVFAACIYTAHIHM